MIYDCFLYNGEKELLEIRLNELSNCKEVVTHILIESSFTHTGNKKPLYFDECKSQFEDWPIVSVTVDKFPKTDSAKEREKYQRNMISEALRFLMPSDKATVIISDVDEIPDYKAVDSFRKLNVDFAALMMKKYGYYLNCFESLAWDRARIMTYGYLKDRSPEEVRDSGFENAIYGGWHFSWLHNRAKEKLESFSHVELNIPDNMRQVSDFKNFWNATTLTDVVIDESFPEYIVNNIDKFKHLIK